MISKFDALTQNEFHDPACRTWRRNGQTKTWKTRQDEFRVPVKHGLYAYGAITHHNAHLVHLPSDSCKKGR